MRIKELNQEARRIRSDHGEKSVLVRIFDDIEITLQEDMKAQPKVFLVPKEGQADDRSYQEVIAAMRAVQ